MENLLNDSDIVNGLTQGPDEINLMFVFGWLVDNDPLYADNLTGVTL